MAIVTKLREPALTKKVPKPAGLPLPQACRTSPAVRGLIRTGEVIQMVRQMDPPPPADELQRRLIETETQVLSKLPVSAWYGAFFLRGKFLQEGRLRYAVCCMCGEEHELGTEELITALLQHTGCRQECCQQKTILSLFWGSMADSLAVQWKLIQVCHPQRLPSYWGGTMDEVYERDMRYGFVRAYQDMLKHLVDLNRPDFRWITPLNPELPFTLDNLTLSLAPWPGIARLNRLSLVIAGQRLPLTELCDTLDVSVEQVLRTLIEDAVNPDELVVALLNQGAER